MIEVRKKKVLLFIITLFIGSIVYATELNVENKIISFPKIEDYVMQGFAVVKDKLFVTFVKKDNVHAYIQVYDLDDYSLYKEYPYQGIGHANDIAYNNKTNEILVLHGNGSHMVSIFDGDDFEFKKNVKVPLPIRGISYNEEEDMYIVRTINSGFKFNSDYTLKSKIPFITAMDYSYDVASQGWTYYDGQIYYAKWSWIRHGGDGTNTIKVLDLSGSTKDELVIDGELGELEDVGFYNGQMILGFNGYEDVIKFYTCDIPEIPREIIDTSEVKEINAEKKKNSPLILFISWLVILSGTYLLTKKLQ